MNQVPNTQQLPSTQKLLETLRQTKVGMERIRGRLSEPLAIVGLGCRFPDADGPDAYWNMLYQGRRVELRSGERWGEDLTAEQEKQPGRITANRGGFLDQIDQFDTGFFGISGREAAMLDPQQRLLLEVAWETFEYAGIDPWQCRGQRVGSFVGICSNDYLHQLTDRPYETIDTYLSTGNSHGAAAGRLSYFMDWRGPAVAVDTACSSSLTALHLAARSLRYGDCEMAMVMGVNVILAPELSISLSQAGMLSPTGRCHTFSDKADGFARGEGCGGILLKRLSRAVEDGDRIICLVRGTATNQDGRSNGLTAPNGQSQQQVIRDALFDAKLKPEAIDYVEAHGTGTPLGDPIEVEALREVFSTTDARVGSELRIGSAKANLGHLEGAAGIAGVIKVALSLANETLPPHPELQKPSERIDWNWPVQVPITAVPWNRGNRMRTAGVSSFGFGGSNVHAILSETPAEFCEPAIQVDSATETASEFESLFVLSARDEVALREQASRWAEYLRQSDEELADVCYTACVGRAPFEYRRAIVTDSIDQLIVYLRGLAAGNTDEHLADSSSNTMTATSLKGHAASTRTEQLILLGNRFLSGESLDWNCITPRPYREPARRITLPTYPFQRVRRWFDQDANQALLGRKLDLAGDAIIYETDLNRFRYLEDHQVDGAQIFPASGFLELAISSGQAATEKLLAVTNLRITRPIIRRAEGSTKVQVQLTPSKSGYNGTIAAKTTGSWLPAATFELCSDVKAIAKTADSSVEMEFDGSAMQEITIADHYQFATKLGIDYGPSFQGVRRLVAASDGTGTAWGTVALPEQANSGTNIFHPALLDACFQVAAGALRDLTTAWLPVAVGSYIIHQQPMPEDALRVDAEVVRGEGTEQISISLKIKSSAGKTLIVINNLRLHPFGDRSTVTRPVATNQRTNWRETLVNQAVPSTSLQDFLHARVADIMGLTVAEVPVNQPLSGLGLDSLMAFELRDELERKLQITIPIELFLEDITLEDFSRIVSEKLSSPADNTSDHQLAGSAVQQASENGWTEGEI